jgi:folate-dependent phosphoribosylglycinamide formyltransferase PurN
VRVLVITGSHRRHNWFTTGLAARLDIAGVIAMPREDAVPEAPEGTSAHDKRNFDRHFRLRDEVEAATFGDHRTIFDHVPTLRIARHELNSQQVAKYAHERAADACVVFGSDILREPLLSELPTLTMNVHLGISPWYRGTATLFWPFYNLEPHWAGATIHRVTAAVDAGPILATCVPALRKGDGIHDVAARCVAEAQNLVLNCLERAATGVALASRPQPSGGRLYLTRHFRPEHLRVNYDLFDDRMVDAYIAGDIGRSEPPTPVEPGV